MQATRRFVAATVITITVLAALGGTAGDATKEGPAASMGTDTVSTMDLGSGRVSGSDLGSGRVSGASLGSGR